MFTVLLVIMLAPLLFRNNYDLFTYIPYSHHRPLLPRLTGDVAWWLESWNSTPKTLGSIPWRGRVTNRFSVPPSQLLCRLVCA